MKKLIVDIVLVLLCATMAFLVFMAVELTIVDDDVKAFKLIPSSQQSAVRSSSQKVAVIPVNQGNVTGKVHVPGYWYTMHATNGAKTVHMPEYKPDVYQLLLYGKLNGNPVSQKRNVPYPYWQAAKIGDTITLK